VAGQPGLPRRYVGGSDKAKAVRVMKAMMEMDKIDIAALEKAARRNDE